MLPSSPESFGVVPLRDSQKVSEAPLLQDCFFGHPDQNFLSQVNPLYEDHIEETQYPALKHVKLDGEFVPDNDSVSTAISSSENSLLYLSEKEWAMLVDEKLIEPDGVWLEEWMDMASPAPAPVGYELNDHICESELSWDPEKTWDRDNVSDVSTAYTGNSKSEPDQLTVCRNKNSHVSPASPCDRMRLETAPVLPYYFGAVRSAEQKSSVPSPSSEGYHLSSARSVVDSQKPIERVHQVTPWRLVKHPVTAHQSGSPVLTSVFVADGSRRHKEQETRPILSYASSVGESETSDTSTSVDEAKRLALRKRKQEQNRSAACRYRDKRRMEAIRSKEELHELELENVRLKTEATNLEKEVGYLKKLLHERFMFGKCAEDRFDLVGWHPYVVLVVNSYSASFLHQRFHISLFLVSVYHFSVCYPCSV
ncbi:hypothetical protein AB6A40_008299 [Gnathostoma spinigerum]|uniref:BZIP domain-containing protein n=1 Tax=Gnathostoma spinigerum TaxID=75299 RepID=A0ABD6ENP0_9BILA